MSKSHEKVVDLDHPWDAVFEAAKRACDRVPSTVLLAADRSTGRIAAMRVVRFGVHGNTTVIDVGYVSDTRTRVRFWSVIPYIDDVLGINRRNIKRFLAAIEEELGGEKQ